MRRHPVFWILVGLAVLVGVWTTAEQSSRVGEPSPGFAVLENLLVSVGGADRGGLQPFDRLRAMDGRILGSAREIQAEVARYPAGTTFRYILYRRGELKEVDIPSRLVTGADFRWFVWEGLVPGVFTLALGAAVFYFKPGGVWSWLFLTFCLVTYLVDVLYADSLGTYRFTSLFLAAWVFVPATCLHAALIFPQRRPIVRRYPRVVWLPYLLSAAVTLGLQVRPSPLYRLVVPALGAAYWGIALILLVVALARTSVVGATPLARQRARVLAVAFALGYLPGVLGTAVEATFRVAVPYLDVLWKLNFAFPAALAYAMVRYDLFDLRAAVRLGTIYSVVTGLVVLAYTGAIALLDLTFTSLGLGRSPIVAATVVALGVVLFLNPVYARTQKVIDRLFFRQRFDVHQSIERVSEVMTGLLDLGRIVELITRTVDELLHPERQSLLLADGDGRGYVLAGEEDEAESRRRIPDDAALPRGLARLRVPVTRERLEEDPRLQDLRDAALAEMTSLDAVLVVPVLFRERVTGLLALGPKRSGSAYSSEDLRLLRLLVNQSALALEHAKAYAALEATNAELKAALRRVEILESIRANLSKFVSKTVQDLIEQAPEAPALDKREVDVSVLFVDIVGYTRLSERLEPETLGALIERYFGAFLDEILKRGGDVNETAGDGFMVIFQDPDPRRHARAAVKAGLAILRRTRELNEDGPEPIAVHVAVNSGPATVGATKLEGAAGTRWTYTASGPVTNLAARLVTLGEGPALIVGAETWRRLAAEFTFEPLGERRLRNVEHPVPVFRLAAPVARTGPVAGARV